MIRRSVWVLLLSFCVWGCQPADAPPTTPAPQQPQEITREVTQQSPDPNAQSAPLPQETPSTHHPSESPGSAPTCAGVVAPPPSEPPPGWTATVTTTDPGFEVCEDPAQPATCRPVAQGELLAQGVTLRTDATAQAVVTLSDGGTVRLDTNTTLTLQADTARSATLTQGRALFDLPEGQTPHARLHLPAGEVVFVGTEVLIDVTAAAQWVTVLRGAIQAGGLTAGAGEELKWVPGEAPQRTPSIDPAGAVDWAEPRDGSVGEVPRGLGSLFAQTPGGGTPRPLLAVERHVTVSIQGWMSYTEITEVFENTSSDTLEGVYRFPLPADAQISRLSLKVGSTWQEGVFVENRRAERIWNQVIADWRDPAWLRWKQGEQFELKIFPIEGRSKREVKIGYTQPLKISGDQQVYRYLMPADPGGAQPVGQFSFHATIEGHDLASGVTVRGYEATTSQPTPQQAKVSFEAKDFRASGDLRLQLRADAPLSALQAAAYSDTHTPTKPFHSAALTLTPDWPAANPSLAPGHDVVLVADVSFSRAGEALTVQAATISRLIELMDGADRVQVIACATTCQPIAAKAWSRPNKALAAEVHSALLAVPAAGTTNLLEGPRVAAALFEARDDKARARGARVIMLTDGEGSAGVQSPAEVRAALTKVLSLLGDARLTPVDLGGGGDPLMLHAMAAGGAGKLITLDPSEALGTAARRILSAQGDQLMTDLRVILPPGFTDVYPSDPLPLAPGEPLRIYAQMPSGEASGEVIIRGRVAGREVEQRIPITLKAEPARAVSYIPRLWAQARIEALELDDPERNRDEIVRLSLTYGLMSRHTSLMALESDAMRREFGLERNNHLLWTGQGEAPKGTTTTTQAPKDLQPALTAPDAGSSASGLGSGEGDARNADNRGKSAGPTRPQTSEAAPSQPSRADDADVLSSPSEDPPPPADKKEPAKASKTKDAKKPSGGGYNLYDDGGGGGYAPPPKRKKPRNHSFAREPKAIDFSSRITKAQAEVDKNPANPQPLKKLIRLLGLAGQDAEAAKAVEAWRAKNPRDVEALLLASEVALRAGRMEEALLLVSNAAEVGARAPWLQTRLLHTYEANDQATLACHQRLSVQGLRPKATTQDGLSCPIASDLSWIEGVRIASSSVMLTSTPAPKSAGIKLSLTWEGAEDLTLALVSSDGRVISAFGGHDDVHVAHAQGAGHETLSIKDLRDGLYSVEVFRPSASASAPPSRGTLTIELPAASIKKTFAWTLSGTRVTIADLRHEKYATW